MTRFYRTMLFLASANLFASVVDGVGGVLGWVFCVWIAGISAFDRES